MRSRLKFGNGFKVQGKMIYPVYFEKDSKNIKTKEIVEGYYPEKFNEVVVDKSMLKWFDNEKSIGDRINIEFLNEKNEEFIISGFYDEGKEISSIYPVLFSKNYSENGEQLKNIPHKALIKIKNADLMSEEQFLDTIREIGEISGIERKDISPNNFFVNSLKVSKQEVIVILLVSLGILFVSILVVYSIFYISVLEDVQKFGQLRTIGASKKQIKAIIRREGKIMFLIGTPIGLIISWIISYWLIPEGWSWNNTIILSLIITIAEFITIIISVQKPADIASSISPVEASKTSRYSEKGLKETKKLHRKLSIYSMSKISLITNKKKYILTLASLGIGGTLFLMSTTLIVSTSLEEYLRVGMYGPGEYIISFDYNTLETTHNGMIEIQLKNIMNEKFIEEINNFGSRYIIRIYFNTSLAEFWGNILTLSFSSMVFCNIHHSNRYDTNVCFEYFSEVF